MVAPYSEVLFSNEKEQSIDRHNNIDESQKYYVKQKKAYTEYPHIHIVLEWAKLIYGYRNRNSGN